MTNTKQLIDILDSEKVEYKLINHALVITIEDVEKELGIKQELMAKSLIVKVPNGYAIAVIPGNCQLSKKELAKVSGYSRNSLDMVPKEEVEKIIGLPLGSIPPFGLGLPVFMDEKLLEHDFVYCGVGSLTLTLNVLTVQLRRLSGAIIGKITL